MDAVPWINPRYCGIGRLASSMSFVLLEESYVDALRKTVYTYFIVSEGVTAKMASVIPAPSPANRTVFA